MKEYLDPHRRRRGRSIIERRSRFIGHIFLT